MSRFFDFFRSLKERNARKRQDRIATIEENLNQRALELRAAGVSPEYWQTTMNDRDALALTGTRYELGEFFRHPTIYGSMRVRVAFVGDLKPFRKIVEA